jgi:two-component system sensor histidine kinase UhpB
MTSQEQALPARKQWARGAGALVRRLLRIPLFYKILLANSAIVALGAIAGTIITVWHVRAFPGDLHYQLIAFFAGVGLAISFAVNYLALKLALDPLDQIQSAVDQVRRGRRDVRLDAGALSDERFDRLAATFNQMLDALEQDARQLHQLSQATLQAQEEERQRVARELHDEAAQALTSLLLRLRLLERADNPADARQHIQELRALTAGALEDVRRIALELRPTILDDLGLAAALSWRVDEFNAAGAARATLQVAYIDGRLPRPIELICYRVAQEALTNVARHARAQCVRIALRQEDGQLALEIRDDGRGFDAAAIGADRACGLGLRGMRERLALVGGELTIDSQPGRGTLVQARVRLPS